MFIEISVNSAVHLTNYTTFQDGIVGFCKVEDLLSFEKNSRIQFNFRECSRALVKCSLFLSNSSLLDKCFVQRHQVKKRGQTETRVEQGTRTKIAPILHFANSSPFMITKRAKAS